MKVSLLFKNNYICFSSYQLALLGLNLPCIRRQRDVAFARNDLFMLLTRFLSLFAAVLICLCSPGLGRTQSADHPNDSQSLQSRAEKAHVAGQTHVDLGTFGGVPPVVQSLDEALKSYSLFLVKLLSTEAVIENGRNVLTWYTLQILERKSSAPPSTLVPSLADISLDCIPHNLPSAANEILLLHNGGTAAVNGVTFTKKIKNFPQLLVSKQYLCVLAVSQDGKIAMLLSEARASLRLTLTTACTP